MAIRTRREYNKDKEEVRKINTLKVSADLQKVILLPRMDQFKTGIFTPRLVVFNETMSQLGKHGIDTAVIWHEAIADRKDEDIASAFYTWIKNLRDVKTLTIWMDNCTGQNKNWTFYSILFCIVNDQSIDVDEIILKYFVVGHTFMASDSAHGRIEKATRKMKTVYDFKDFKTCINNANCEFLEMETRHFNGWKPVATQYQLSKMEDKRPCIEQIVYVRVKKGDDAFHYKKDLLDKEIAVFFTRPNGFEILKQKQLEVSHCKKRNKSSKNLFL